MAGAELFDEIAAWVDQYLAVPSEHHIRVITLWAAHTHTVAAFYVTPRLIIDSAEPESGKTRVLELLNLVCRAPIFTMNTTIAALYRRLAREPRTVLLDETDAIFAKGAAQNHEDLRALLDSGYKRGATVDRCVGDAAKMEVKEFPVFAPAALAGIAGRMPDTITTRSITLNMRRRAPDEEVAEFIEEDARPAAERLSARLEAWAADGLESMRGARPMMPAGVRDRKAEIWRALLVVADRAGGDWPDQARAACRHFVLDERGADTGSVGVRLLGDLRRVFGDDEAMWTDTILERLHKLDEAPWGDWYGHPLTARDLAKRLKPYGVRSGTVRVGNETAKGYRRVDLWDPWTRYGVPGQVSDTSDTSVTPLASTVTDVSDVSHTPGVAAPGNGHRTTRLEPLEGVPAGRPCGICSQWFVPHAPSRAVCDQCRPHLAAAVGI